VPAFGVKLGANDLNCVDVPLNPTLLTHYSLTQDICSFASGYVVFALLMGSAYIQYCEEHSKSFEPNLLKQ